VRGEEVVSCLLSVDRTIRADPSRASLVTMSWFTTAENFSEAGLVVSALGDPGGERVSVTENRVGRSIGAYVQLEDVAAVLRM
jgi:hypothetical protein